jgi:hypothetical protein
MLARIRSHGPRARLRGDVRQTCVQIRPVLLNDRDAAFAVGGKNQSGALIKDGGIHSVADRKLWILLIKN